MPASTQKSRCRLNPDRLALLSVAAAAVWIAVVSYLGYLGISRLRWAEMFNDRNAHYLLGQSLALDLLNFDVRNLLSDLDGARTWPPLHGILVAAVLLFGGIDYRLAVLPSLLAWIGTVVLGFLVARRAVDKGGNAAGLVAAIFILASPAHRVFATDVMLESLGACLSLLALYCYLVASQEPSARSYRNLSLALTALFLTKYNYWLLVAAGILGAAVIDGWRQWRQILDAGLRSVTWRDLAVKELKQPLNYVALVSIVLMLAVLLGGGGVYEVWGRTISIRSHHNFVQVAYTALFIRVVLWWAKTGRARTRAGDFRIRQLAVWHLWPVAIWLLLPKRLGYMLFFLSPANGPNSPVNFFWGLDFYATALVRDYHTQALSASLALGLLILGALALRRLKPGASAILLFVLIAALLTIAHPNRKSRFLHSWIPAAWVAAGIGASVLIYRRSTRREPLAAAALATFLALWVLKEPFAPGHSPEAGHSRLGHSALDISDYYLPHLEQTRRATFLATVPAKHFAGWTFFERYKQREGWEIFIRGFGPSPEENRLRFDQWLRTTRSDTVVFVDVPQGSRLYSGAEEYAQFRELLSSQSLFKPVSQRHFPQHGCTVSVWKRDGAGVRASPSCPDCSRRAAR